MISRLAISLQITSRDCSLNMTLRVLIIDDNPTFCEGLVKLISLACGDDTIELAFDVVGTLQEGLLLADRANVTILDLGLPDSQDPLNTILYIPQFRPPVLVYTGDASEEIRKLCKMYNAEHVFEKGSAYDFLPAVFEAMSKDVVRRASERPHDHAT